MNDIEREIEGITEEKEIERKENENISKKINYKRSDDNKKKIIIFVVIGLILIVLIGVTIYLLTNKKDDKKENNNEIVNKEDENKKDNENEGKRMGYVSCDDNAGQLNVRNSTTGDIVDGLSCFKSLIIEEELPETDACSKWYKVSYEKHGSSYTGYACAKYIKEEMPDKEDLETVTDLFEKANDYYEKSRLYAYCGKTTDTKKVHFNTENMDGEYLKSEFKTISELKNHITSFIAETLIDTNLELSNYNNPKYYDNYYEIDGNLYCRNYAGKGWHTYYTSNYDIEITNKTDNKITANIAYEYLKENSNCDIKKLSSCSSSNFEYKLGKIVLEKKDNNFIITNIDFHE